MKISDETLYLMQSYLRLVIAAELFILALVAIWRIPQYQVINLRYFITDPSIIADTENRYRTTLAQIFGGITIGIGLYFSWRRISTNERRADIAENGQITERFTRAVDQLGSDKLEIRTGGIYSLERIAKESDEDYWPIMEILTSYVRKNSPISLEEDNNDLPIDIQSVITVLQRRRKAFTKGETDVLNLKNTYLKEVDFKSTNLVWANLTKANLTGAHFTSTNLTLTMFTGANLTRACFIMADLTAAFLEGTNLTGAKFHKAILREVDFTNANLTGVVGLSINQLSQVKTLYGATLDSDLKEKIIKNYPQLFKKQSF